MSDDIAFMPVAQLLGAFRTKSITPVEAVEAALGRIGAHNGVLNAFCHVDEDGARAAARASQARWMKGEPQGLLDGLPLSVKDSLMVKGMPARYGSKTTSADPVAEDTSTVASARRHGAVILGKTTTPEYGLGAVTNSPLTGITLNPWDTDKTSGGSSGGGAAAVAAGMGNAALGTDAGGSIRIPASLNGLVALKSTNGRIPQYPLTWVPSLMALSVLTHTVTDSALMLNVLSEPGPRDAPAFPADGVDYLEGLDDGIAGLRIAFSATLGYAPHVNAEVAELAAAAARSFVQLGATVVETDPGFDNPGATFRAILFPSFAHFARRFTPDQMELLGPAARDTAKAGGDMSIGDYLAADKARAALVSHMHRFHQTHDLLLTPTVASAAFTAGRWGPEEFEEMGDMRAWAPFGNPFNLTGQPAATVPCGFNAEGLPVGLQIVGARFADALVLRAARAYEQAHPQWERRPPLA